MSMKSSIFLIFLMVLFGCSKAEEDSIPNVETNCVSNQSLDNSRGACNQTLPFSSIFNESISGTTRTMSPPHDHKHVVGTYHLASQSHVEEAIANGCTNFTELCNKTGAGLGCGSCKTEVREILNNAKVLV